MNKFTKGEWKENADEIFLPNGKWYKANGFVSDEEMQANARLIAAAPKMYELLKVWTQVGAEPMLMNARDTARKLLARIDGEEAEE